MSALRNAGVIVALVLGAAFIGIAPARAGDAIPQPGKAFEVTVTDASGTPKEAFYSGDEAVFNVSFGLMLSEIKAYPVVVTITVGKDTMEAFNGRLDEGMWLITQKVKVLANWKNSALWKVVLKVRMSNRNDSGTTSYYVYNKAEGSFGVQ